MVIKASPRRPSGFSTGAPGSPQLSCIWRRLQHQVIDKASGDSKQTPHARRDAEAQEEKRHMQEEKAAGRKRKGVALAANTRELHACGKSRALCLHLPWGGAPIHSRQLREGQRGMKERREGKRRGNLELVEPDPRRPACGRVDSATLCLSANLRVPVTLLLPFSLKSAPSAQVFPSLCYVTCVSSALVLVCVWLGLAFLILQLDGLCMLVFLVHYLLSYIL